jgi:exodeoxyribonuclease-1
MVAGDGAFYGWITGFERYHAGQRWKWGVIKDQVQNHGDKRLLDNVRAATPEELAGGSYPFEDERLPELLFRYRARNFPDSLNAEEREQWEAWRFQRLTDPEMDAGLDMESFHTLIEQRLQDPGITPEQVATLQQLLDYGDSLLA